MGNPIKLENLMGKYSSYIPEKFENTEIKNVTCNSKEVKEGTAFVCIKGTNADGHKYAKDAQRLGATVIVTSDKLGLENEINVPNTREAFGEMCCNYFGNPSKSLKCIGVTGTNGKTSITYMVKHILEECGYKCGVIGTISNLIGNVEIESTNTTPDAYHLQMYLRQMVDAGMDYCVMETSSHALDQERMYGINYEVGVFTNLTQDHLDYHVTMENYMEAKKKLFKISKVGVFNFDDPWYGKITSGDPCQIVSYSMKDSNADFYAENIRYFTGGVSFEFVGVGIIERFKVKVPGAFTVYNSMAAISACLKLGIHIDDISKAMQSFTGVKGRAEVAFTNDDFTVVIDYAHTPDGIEKIINALKPNAKGRIVTVFGCGGDRDKTKRPKMRDAAMKYSDFVVVTSDNPRTENPTAIIDDIMEGNTWDVPYVVIEDRIEAINYAIENAQKDDIIVLCGKGHETYQIVGTVKHHMDEREIVADAIKRLNIK